MWTSVKTIIEKYECADNINIFFTYLKVYSILKMDLNSLKLKKIVLYHRLYLCTFTFENLKADNMIETV